MSLSSLPGVLGITALAFLLLLIVKQLTQPARDNIAKVLGLIVLTGLLSLTWSVVFTFFALDQRWPSLSNVAVPILFSIGPALYFYVRRVTDVYQPTARELCLHCLPAMFAVAVLIPYYRLPNEQKVAYILDPSGAGYFLILLQVVWSGVFIHILLYIYACQPYVRRLRQRLRVQYSAIAKANWNWLQAFCYGFVAYVLLYLLLPLVGISKPDYHLLLSMLMHLFVMMLAYAAIGRSQLQFVGGWQSDVDDVCSGNKKHRKDKYHRSGLRVDTAHFYRQKLEQKMTQERYFLDSALSLKDLAGHMDLSLHNLSQLLNEHVGSSFYDYINEQRIDYAKNLLVRNKDKPIIDIALQSGFNNKNSFSNSFKRYVGMTPSAYRKLHNAEKS